MKRLTAFAALIIGMLCAFPASAQIYCRQTAVYDASTNGATVLRTAQTGSSISICGFNIWAAGTATVKLVYGTGTTCGTNETAITPAYSLTTQTGVADASPVFRGLSVPAGNDLCIKTSAGVAVQAQVFLVQR